MRDFAPLGTQRRRNDLTLRGRTFYESIGLSQVLEMCDSRYSILEILAVDVCFVNFFRSILPVVPAECDVLIACRQHNDKEWKFKERHAKVWKNIAGAKRYSPTCGVFASAADDGGIDASLKRAYKRSFSTDIVTLDELLKSLAPYCRRNCIPHHTV